MSADNSNGSDTAKARAIAKAESIKRAVRDPNLSHGAARLFILLTTYARWTETHGWLCWPGVRLLSKQMGAKPHSIIKWIKELESAAYLEAIRQVNHKSFYVLRFENPLPFPATDSEPQGTIPPLPKWAPLPKGTTDPLPKGAPSGNGKTVAHFGKAVAQKGNRTSLSEPVVKQPFPNGKDRDSSQRDSHGRPLGINPRTGKPKRRLNLRKKIKPSS